MGLYYFRWMKLWKINIASERKQRNLMKAHLAELEVEAETIPFAFPVRRAHHDELRPSSMAYITDLETLIHHLLEEKQK